MEKHFNNISKRKGKGRIVKGEIIPVKFKEKQIKVKGKYGDVLEPRPFEKGGAVRMAKGGDGLGKMQNALIRSGYDKSYIFRLNPTQVIDLYDRVYGTGEGKDYSAPTPMAKGGLDSVLENMNQQNFTPDPADRDWETII